MLLEYENKSAWLLLKEGNPHSLELLYQEHYLGLMNYGIIFCGERDLVRDCISQILIELWDVRQKLPDVQHVRSYMITTLRRKLLKEMKVQRQVDFFEEANLKSHENNELSYEEYLVHIQDDELLKQKIFQAFAKLSERQKEMIKLRFFEDKDYDEIAEQCGITKRTAYNIIYDALTRLRKDLTSDLKSI